MLNLGGIKQNRMLHLRGTIHIIVLQNVRLCNMTIKNLLLMSVQFLTKYYFSVTKTGTDKVL